MMRAIAARADEAPGRFEAALRKWMGDTPLDVEKPFGSIVLGSQCHVTIFDADNKIGAKVGEPLEFCGGEIKPNVVAFGIVDDHADEGLRTDGRLHQPSTDPDLVGSLSDSDFVHDDSPVDSVDSLAAAAPSSSGKCRAPR